MALAETARLVTELSLRDQLTPGLARARGALASASGAAAIAGTRIGGLSGIAAGASSAFGTFSGRVTGLVRGVGLLAGTGGVLGLAAGLSSAVTKAKDFAQAMELVHTQAGASQSEVDDLTKSVLALAPAVGTSPELLAAGLFHVESAGFRGAKALEVLKIAAEGAKIGNADLEGVTNALVASVNSGIGGVKSISEAMGVLNGVVGAGNLRMEDLAQAFGTGILSTAKSFGISMQSVGAAIADMASQGIPAIDAATRLRMTISLLGAPTAGAAAELKKIGLSSTQLAKDMRTPGGILTAVQDLKAHLDKSGLSAVDSAALISRAFGGGRTSSAILTLLGSVDKLKTAQDQIGKSAGDFGEAWNKTVAEADFKFESFKATMDATLIRVGNVLLPTITEALGNLGKWASEHGDDITRFAQGAVAFARTAAGTIKTVFGALSSAWNLIPPWVRDFLIKGFIVDRTIKFLFGFSPAKMIVSFAADTIGSLFGKIAANRLVPQLVQAAAPIPVFVTNPGFGMGGGVGGGAATAAEDAAAMGGLRGLINKIPLAVVGAIDVAAIAGVVATWMDQNKGITVASDFEKQAVADQRKAAGDNLAELQKLRATIESQISAGGGDPLASLLKNLFVNPQLKEQLADLDKKITALGGAVPANRVPTPGGAVPAIPQRTGATGPTAGGGVPLPVNVVQSDYATRHPTGIAPINPATVSDFALRHRELQKPATPQEPPISAADFERILRTTPFIGTAQYKSIFERFSTAGQMSRGKDPVGEGFLELVKRLKDPKAPAVMFEIRGHLKELASLEAYYIAHGDTKNALKVQGVINEVDRLIGITQLDHKATDAAQKAHTAAVRAQIASSARIPPELRSNAKVVNAAVHTSGVQTAAHLAILTNVARRTGDNTANALPPLRALQNRKANINVAVTNVVNARFSVNGLQNQLVHLSETIPRYAGKTVPL